MFKKILFPLDGTEPSLLARSWIRYIAPRQRAEIVLLRVIDTTLLLPEMEKAVFRVAQDHLQQVERYFNFNGLPCKVVVRSGKPAPSIAKEADEDSADLVVLATHQAPTPLGREPGGVTDGVLRQCSVPVLLLHPKLKPSPLDRIRRVIVPLDHAAEETVAWAARLAKTLRAQVVFLALRARRLRGSAAGQDDRLEELRSRMMEIGAELRRLGVTSSVRVLRGDPSTCTLACTGANDLLLLTAPCHQDPEQILPRSVEGSILDRAEVPVVILKEHRLRASEG